MSSNGFFGPDMDLGLCCLCEPGGHFLRESRDHHRIGLGTGEEFVEILIAGEVGKFGFEVGPRFFRVRIAETDQLDFVG